MPDPEIFMYVRNVYIHVCAIFQTHVLKKASESDPDTWWWIKGDGVDVVKGLKESIRGEWSGDADQNDGYLNNLYQEYQSRLKATACIGLGDHCSVELDLNTSLQEISADLTFIHSGLQIRICT